MIIMLIAYPIALRKAKIVQNLAFLSAVGSKGNNVEFYICAKEQLWMTSATEFIYRIK